MINIYAHQRNIELIVQHVVHGRRSWSLPRDYQKLYVDDSSKLYEWDLEVTVTIEYHVPQIIFTAILVYCP